MTHYLIYVWRLPHTLERLENIEKSELSASTVAFIRHMSGRYHSFLFYLVTFLELLMRSWVQFPVLTYTFFFEGKTSPVIMM